MLYHLDSDNRIVSRALDGLCCFMCSCSLSSSSYSCNCDEEGKIAIELELRRTESKCCDYPPVQMIDYHQKKNYPYLALYNYSGNTIFPKITYNHYIEQIGFPPAYTDFDDSCIERMEKENPELPEPGPSHVSVENTATAEETQSTSSDCHTRTCLCCECQEKYGSLPLFAQVLESHQQTTDVDRTCDERDRNEIPQQQPSTSSSVQYPSTSKPKPFQCDICQKRFSHRGDYHKHVRIHSGDRPYACAFCPLRFAHPSNRARHLRSHSTERPYHCKECNRNFYRKDKLDRHRMSNKCRKRNERQDRR